MGADALQAARAEAVARDPREAAAACGVAYEGDAERGTFEMPLFGQVVRLSYPGFTMLPEGAQVPPHVVALLVYHLARSDGTVPAGDWCSFAELPDGTFYVRAFRGYTSALIERRFGGRDAALSAAARSLGGEPLAGLADLAWRVPALPRVPVALLWWCGDAEFGPRADLLFDATATRHLPIDGVAVLGSWMTAALMRAAEG